MLKLKNKHGYFIMIFENFTKEDAVCYFFDEDFEQLGGLMATNQLEKIFKLACLVLDQSGELITSFDDRITTVLELQQYTKKIRGK